MAAFTGEEVFLAELINRARSDPQAEGARLGMDLTDGLTAEEIALLGPVEPLALDLSLTLAARAHSLDMASRGFLDHVNPEGLNPTDRVRAAGYSGVAGESIAAGQPAVERAYETWMASVANRLNILSLFADFDAGFHYDQFGAGYTTEGEPQDPHYTALFGDPGAGSTAWLLGVVYADSDGDEFYSVGEGAGGVRIDVAAAGDPATIVATYTTDEAGNYQLRLGDGSWVVTFTDIGTGNLVIKQVATGGQNVKLDALLAEFDPPAGNGDGGGDDGQGDGGDGDGDGGDGGDGNGDGGDDGGSAQDDHADDGDYANASLITLSDAGEGAAAGVIGAGTDTDLLYFTATAAGELSVTLDCSSGDLVGAILLRSESGLPLAAESADAGGGAVVLSWSVPAGEQYFLVIASADLVSTGDYTLHLAMPSSSDDGGDGNGDGDSGDGDGTDDGDGDGDDGGGDGSGGDGGDDGDGG
ncbi:MAG TPA: CAP domain-containing protein, partial [Phycisphaerales bacterium]|nr:CAP domain-containing protein [Phycisphaerales bacterium]